VRTCDSCMSIPPSTKHPRIGVKSRAEVSVRRSFIDSWGDIAHQLAATSEVRKPTFSSSAVVVYAKTQGHGRAFSRDRLRVPLPNRQLLSRTDWERPVLNAENRAGGFTNDGVDVRLVPPGPDLPFRSEFRPLRITFRCQHPDLLARLTDARLCKSRASVSLGWQDTCQ